MVLTGISRLAPVFASHYIKWPLFVKPIWPIQVKKNRHLAPVPLSIATRSSAIWTSR
jgi:hypothetical protein